MLTRNKFRKLLFFDTETSGLKSFKEHIVSLSWVLFDRLAPPNNFSKKESFIIRPEGWTISKESEMVHGISTEYATSQGYDGKYVMETFLKDVEQADLLVAYNIGFDLGFIQKMINLYNINKNIYNVPNFCLMKIATPLLKLPPTEKMIQYGYGPYKAPKLSELYWALYHKPLDGAHDSLIDVLATVDCYKTLFNLGLCPLEDMQIQ